MKSWNVVVRKMTRSKRKPRTLDLAKLAFASLVTLGAVLMFGASAGDLPETQKSDLQKTFEWLQTGIENHSLLLPGQCSISSATFKNTDEFGFLLPFEKLNLTVQKKFLVETTIDLTMIVNRGTEEIPGVKFSARPYSHWFRDTIEVKYEWAVSPFGMKALINGSFGGFPFKEKFRMIYDPKTNEILFLELKQKHTGKLIDKHIVCEK